MVYKTKDDISFFLGLECEVKCDEKSYYGVLESFKVENDLSINIIINNDSSKVVLPLKDVTLIRNLKS